MKKRELEKTIMVRMTEKLGNERDLVKTEMKAAERWKKLPWFLVSCPPPRKKLLETYRNLNTTRAIGKVNIR